MSESVESTEHRRTAMSNVTDRMEGLEMISKAECSSFKRLWLSARFALQVGLIAFALVAVAHAAASSASAAGVTGDGNDPPATTNGFTPVASVRIVFDAVPNDAQDFSFATTGSGLGAFTLDDDADGTLLNAVTFPLYDFELGAKSITQGAVSGWTLIGLLCTGDANAVISNANRRVDLNVQAGETIHCTFSNQKRATVAVVVDANPDNPQDFSYTTTGTGLSAFTLDDDGPGGSATPPTVTFTLPVEVGTKTITEGAVAGWTLTNIDCSGTTETVSLGTRTVTFAVAAGAVISCRFLNTKNAMLTIAKVTDPVSDPQDFDFDLTGAALPVDLDLDTDATSTTVFSSATFVIPGNQLGTKTVVEPPIGNWSLMSATCNHSATPIANGLSIGVDPGEEISCTFTSAKLATLDIVLDAIPNDAQDFDFDATGGFIAADFDLDDDADPTLANSRHNNLWPNLGALGSKTIGETAVAGWTLTNLQCTGDTEAQVSLVNRQVLLDVDAGENIVCTFTNTKSATLQIVMYVYPHDGQDFDFDLVGAGLPADLDLDDDTDPTLPNFAQVTLPAAQFGTKTITESVSLGWKVDQIDCSGDAEAQTSLVNRRATIDVDAGEVITCAFVNTTDTSLQIVQDSVPDDPQDFDFDGTGTAILADFDLDDDAARGLSNSVLFPIKRSELGPKTITESAIAGWNLSDLQCTGDSEALVSLANRQATLDIDGGENVVCTFYNTKTAATSAQPDGRIRKGATAPFLGNNIYNADGTNQFVQGVKPVGYAVKFTISIQNDGTTPDQFLVQATGTTVAGYRVKYFFGTTDITAAVVAGTYQTSSLAVGASVQITVKVKVLSTAAVGSSVTRLVTLTSVADGSKHDSVKFTGKRK